MHDGEYFNILRWLICQVKTNTTQRFILAIEFSSPIRAEKKAHWVPPYLVRWEQEKHAFVQVLRAGLKKV